MPDGPLLEVENISLCVDAGDVAVITQTPVPWDGLDTCDVRLSGGAIAGWPADVRLHAGLFTTTGRPSAVPGIRTIDLVHRMATSGSALDRQALAAAWCDRLGLDPALLRRPLDADFTSVEAIGVEFIHLAMLRPAVAVVDLVADLCPTETNASDSIVNGIREIRSDQPDIAVVVVTNDDELIAALTPDHVTTCADADVSRTHRDEALL